MRFPLYSSSSRPSPQSPVSIVRSSGVPVLRRSSLGRGCGSERWVEGRNVELTFGSILPCHPSLPFFPPQDLPETEDTRQCLFPQLDRPASDVDGALVVSALRWAELFLVRAPLPVIPSFVTIPPADVDSVIALQLEVEGVRSFPSSRLAYLLKYRT